MHDRDQLLRALLKLLKDDPTTLDEELAWARDAGYSEDEIKDVEDFWRRTFTSDGQLLQ